MMYKEVEEVECSDCDGLGEKEDNKGRMKTCPSCKGKGKIYDQVEREDPTAEEEWEEILNEFERNKRPS